MAPYRPKSLDELNQAYDKAKAQQPVSRPAPAAPQPPQPAPKAQPTPGRSIADAVRAQESKQALSGAVDDFIKEFSTKETAPQSAYSQAQQTAQETGAQASREIAQETQQAFDDVLSFPEIKTKPLEPPVYHRYTPPEEAPIKEGDLSGLMDEYIAVMTDQNGEEEENRRSFLRRRKERKKSKQTQAADSEAAADLFDVPEPEPVSPVVPPVAPVEIPFEEPVAPVEIPVEEPAAPVEILFEEPVAPAEIPVEAAADEVARGLAPSSAGFTPFAALGGSSLRAEAGSLKLTIFSSYLETLDPGYYLLRIVFDDGEVYTMLTINAKAADAEVEPDDNKAADADVEPADDSASKDTAPKTGDDTPVSAVMLILLISAAGLSYMLGLKREKRR